MDLIQRGGRVWAPISSLDMGRIWGLPVSPDVWVGFARSAQPIRTFERIRGDVWADMRGPVCRCFYGVLWEAFGRSEFLEVYILFKLE